jgi:hypothetical protein
MLSFYKPWFIIETENGAYGRVGEARALTLGAVLG